MHGPRRPAALIVALVILAGGCASATGHPAAPAPPAAPEFLATSLAGQQMIWAAIPMGAASGPDLFWQLFALPAAGTSWSLVTPPDIPTNGALVLAGLGGRSLAAGMRPSLGLHYSPLTTTPDGGRTWAAGPVNAGLADVPDALAAAPGGGELIALTADGQVGQASPTGTGWVPLTSKQSLAATPAGRGCGLARLTAAAYTPPGVPLLAGTCARHGVAGVFAYRGGSWQAAGPSLPASLTSQQIQVLRLTRTGTRDVALLQAGTGSAATLVAAWSADGSHWTLSGPLRLGGPQVVSASFGKDGAAAVVLAGSRAATIAGPGASWRRLPVLPSGRTVLLALPAAGGIDALAASGSNLSAWRLAPARPRGPGPRP
jgi:hypothetical protein